MTNGEEVESKDAGPNPEVSETVWQMLNEHNGKKPTNSDNQICELECHLNYNLNYSPFYIVETRWS